MEVGDEGGVKPSIPVFNSEKDLQPDHINDSSYGPWVHINYKKRRKFNAISQKMVKALNTVPIYMENN